MVDVTVIKTDHISLFLIWKISIMDEINHITLFIINFICIYSNYYFRLWYPFLTLGHTFFWGRRNINSKIIFLLIKKIQIFYFYILLDLPYYYVLLCIFIYLLNKYFENVYLFPYNLFYKIILDLFIRALSNRTINNWNNSRRGHVM